MLTIDLVLSEGGGHNEPRQEAVVGHRVHHLHARTTLRSAHTQGEEGKEVKQEEEERGEERRRRKKWEKARKEEGNRE